MNTATPVITTRSTTAAAEVAPQRTGAGRIDLANAAAGAVVAFNADEPGVVNLSFGAPDVLGSYTAVHNLRVRNWSDAPQSFDVRYVPVSDMPGVELIAPITLTVPPRGSVVAPVRMEANAVAMRNNRIVDSDASQPDLVAWQSEESGLLWLWRPTAPPLRWISMRARWHIASRHWKRRAATRSGAARPAQLKPRTPIRFLYCAMTISPPSR
jgi:hypothetical protein